MEQSEAGMIFDNEEFGCWAVTVERPLRLRVYPDRKIPADTFKKTDEFAAAKSAVDKAAKTAPLDDWTEFAKATKRKASVLKKIRPFITVKDPTAQPIDGEPDASMSMLTEASKRSETLCRFRHVSLINGSDKLESRPITI